MPHTTSLAREIVSPIPGFHWPVSGCSTNPELAICAGKSGKGPLMERACYQFGNLTRKKRAKGRDTWEFRYYESTGTGERRRKSCIVGTVEKLPTKAHAQKAVEALLLKLNSETPRQRMSVVSFGAICDRYLEEELPERYSTAKSYKSNIKNYLKPRWATICSTRFDRWRSRIGLRIFLWLRSPRPISEA